MAIDKVIRIEGSSITWTYKQVVKMIEKETISFSNVVQRSFVWSKQQMSELIWSIVTGYPVPPIFCVRGTSDNEKVKHFDCLDGRQRCTTIYMFLNDGFTLTKLKPIPYLDENGDEQFIDISGRKYSELDEELQDIIKDATITVKYFNDLPQDKRAEMFRRMNNGKALSAKARSLASAVDIEGLLNVGSHELFNQMLTEKSRENKNQAIIVLKAHTMLNEDIQNISFASKDFNPMIENTQISNTEKLELSRVFDYIVNVHDELKENHEKDVAKRLYTETHMISLIPYIKQSMENNISESMFADFLINFFKTENNSDLYTEYMGATSNGVARNASIVARHNALRKSYEDFFKKDSENILTTA